MKAFEQNVLNLLKRIVEDLNPMSFTLSEIQEEYNDDRAVLYGKKHIVALLESSLIDDSGEGSYYVTPAGHIAYEEVVDSDFGRVSHRRLMYA